MQERKSAGRKHLGWWQGLALVALLAAPMPLAGQAVTPSVSAEAPLARINAARAALAPQLDEARRAAKDADAGEPVQNALTLLQQLDLVYAEQLAALKAAADLLEARTRMTAALQQMQSQGLEEKPPYSLLLLDGVQDELDTAREEANLSDAAVRSAQEALQQMRDLAAEREQSRRAAREALETNSDPAAAPALQVALNVAQIESRLANERVTLQSLQLENEEHSQAVQNQRVAVLQARADLLAVDACLQREDLNSQLVALAKEEEELQRSLASARRELETADRRFMQAQQRAAQQEESPSLRAELEARRRAQETLQLETSTLARRLHRLADLKAVWQRRYEVSEQHPPRAQLAEWRHEAEEALAQLGREERLQQGRLAQLRQAGKSLNDEIVAQVASAPEVAKWLIEQQERLQDQAAVYDAELSSLESARHLQEKLIDQIERKAATRSWRERAAVLYDDLLWVWAYELTSVDDRPITVGKVVGGVILFLMGLWVARTVSRVLGRRILPRLGLDKHASAALQSITFYILLSLLTLFALNVVKVPLAVFTFVGGALAIGIGFGSQNIVNNFISGLILLAERPIKVGDLIEVDGTRGTVDRIGPRSTRVRLSNNIDILVPNSAFLEKNVVNWTLSDNSVRTAISIGVAYGSPTERVRALLLEAAMGHDRVLAQPAPTVLFTDFGDNALHFELQFWLRVRTDSDRRNAESDVRFRIDRAFRDAAISIAYPQRDVHIDASQPLAVRVVSSGDDGTA